MKCGKKFKADFADNNILARVVRNEYRISRLEEGQSRQDSELMKRIEKLEQFVKRIEKLEQKKIQTNSIETPQDSKKYTLYRCTVCGRVGTVARCCGNDTREPLVCFSKH